VAEVWGDAGRMSFDGERPTNGFHPLWQLLLADVSRVLRWLGLSRTVVGLTAGCGLLIMARLDTALLVADPPRACRAPA
jgi:hypothetical protein